MLIFLFGLIFILVASYAYAGFSAAPWVPCRSADTKRICDLAKICPSDTVIELGCGDGRILAAAARRGARCIGYEISILPYLIARIRAQLTPAPYPRPKILLRSFWSTDISVATVVIIFLMPAVYKKLSEKLLREAAPGTRIIFYVWPMREWQPVQIDKPSGRPALYLYEIPNQPK